MLALLLSGAVKGALLLALALPLTRLLRHRSAAARHLTLWTALVAAALLPLASLALPAWRLEVPAAIVAPAVIQAPVATVPAVTRQEGPPEVQPRATVAPAPPIAPITRAAKPLPLPTILLLAWSGVALLLVAQLLVSLVRLATLTRKATSVRELGWDLPRRVRLLQCDAIAVPLTWGLLRPVVLLPSSSRGWSRERWTLVLRHELAHIERGDLATQLFARACCAVYWFNPLMWIAARALERERERACDDRVLAAGALPSGYAGELLDFAVAESLERYAGAALAMARKSELEGRLLSILDPKVRRTVPGALAAVSVGVAALVLTLPLAALQPSQGVRLVPPPPAVAPTPAPAVPSPRAAPSSRAPAAPAPVAARMPVTPPQQAGELCPRGNSSHSSQNITDSGDKSWRVSWTGDDCSVDLRAQGEVKFTADLTDVESLSPGGTLAINVRTGGTLRRLEISNAGGALRRTWMVNGSAAPFDDAARRWLSAFLLELDRHTAFAVEARLPALLKQGGPDAVLNEIDLMASDYPRATYSIALLDRAKLTPAQVLRLAQGSAQRIDSDYELGRVLKRIATGYSLDDAGLRAAFMTGAGTLQSDYERAELLMTLIEKGAVSREAAPTAVTLAAAMSSDYEKSRVLLALGGSKLVDPKTVAPEYLTAVGKMSSDYERGRVLKLLAGSGQLSREALIRLLQTTGAMESDYEAASVLVTVAGSNAVDGDVRAAYLQAAGRLKSDYERQRATAALVKP